MAFDQNKPATSSSLSSADMRNNSTHIKNAILKEHNWNDADPNATTHKLDVINLTVTASTQGNLGTGGGMGPSTVAPGSLNVLNQQTGISAGTYNLKQLLQEIINRSHTHGFSALSWNCNCNCCNN
jgi:hypothetical protein